MSSTIFILGNGPSLKDFDLKNAEKVGKIFGTNASSILSQEKDVRQDYHFVNDLRFLSDPNRAKLITDDYLDRETIRIVGSECRYGLPRFSGKTRSVKVIGNYGFSINPKSGFYHGYSIVNLAFQYALTMSPEAIVFCGVDLNYSGDEARFYEKIASHAPDPFRGKQLSVLKLGLEVAKSRGTKIFISGDKSLFASYVPQWCW